MEGIIGKKIGMTSIYTEEGKSVPCTLVEAGPCVVTQIKTEEVDGYYGVQIGFDDMKEKSSNKPEIGHFKKASTGPKRKVVEFAGYKDKKLGDLITAEIFEEGEWVDVTGTSKGKGFQGVVKRKVVEFAGYKDKKLGDLITAEIFEEGEWVDVTGTSKGKGFQGVVKRHGFHGVGGQTHGQHNRGRAPGSIGAASTPSKVIKGMRMAGQTGNKRSTILNLKVMKVIADKNVLVLKGAIPGAKGSYVVIHK